jgi:RNase P protein component
VNLPASCDRCTSRVGLTVSRKCGGSVERSRIKRRLRAAVRLVAPQIAQRNIDLVVVARAQAIDAAFGDLVADIGAGLASLDRPARPGRKPAGQAGHERPRDEMPQGPKPVAKDGPAPHLSRGKPASVTSSATSSNATRASSVTRAPDSPHSRSGGRDHDRS